MAGALNEQLSPSALRPPLPAAKAALEALMQQISSAAAAISMINLMARSLPENRAISRGCHLFISPKSRVWPVANRPGTCIKTMQYCIIGTPAGF